jgi:hypothetical protein
VPVGVGVGGGQVQNRGGEQHPHRGRLLAAGGKARTPAVLDGSGPKPNFALMLSGGAPESDDAIVNSIGGGIG